MKAMKEKTAHFLVLAALCLLACSTIGIPNTYGMFYQPLSQMLETGKANATLHVSIAGLATGLSSPLVVKAIRKYSYRPVILCGILCLLISGYVIGTSRNLLLTDLMGVVRGLGLACSSNVIITMLTGNWFLKQRGTVSGFIMSFSGIMGSLFSPAVSFLLERYAFTKAYLICIFLMVLLALPALLIPFRPEDIGLNAYGHDMEETDETNSYEGCFDLRFTGKDFLLLVFTSLLVICVTTLTSYLPSYVESLKQAAGNGAALLSASMIGNVLFKFLIGICIDRKGVFFSFVSHMAISFLGLLLIVLMPQNSTILFIAGILYGACYAVNKVAIPLTVRIFFGDDKYGEAYSVLSLCENIARSIVITSIGFIYDHSGSYLICFLIALVTSQASSLMILYQKGRMKP